MNGPEWMVRATGSELDVDADCLLLAGFGPMPKEVEHEALHRTIA